MTIRKRIVAGFAVLSLAVLGAFAVGVVELTEARLLRTLDSSLGDWATVLANATEPSGGRLVTELSPEVESRFDTREPWQGFIVFDEASGAVISSSPTLRGDPMLDAFKAVRRRIGAPDSPWTREAAWSEEHGHPERHLRLRAALLGAGAEDADSSGSRPAARRQAVPVVVVIACDTAPMRRELSTLWGAVAIAGAAALLAAIGGGWLLARRIARPLTAMAAAAANATAGDRAPSVPVFATHDEVETVGHALNAAFARLHAAGERERRFAADASHELRTPVAIIRAQAESALRRDRPAAEYEEALREITTAADRMQRLITGLLFLASMDGGAADDAGDPVNLGDIARDSAARHAAAATAKGLTIDVSGPDVVVSGNGAAISLAVDNVLTNALRYSDQPGVIRVTLAVSGCEAVLTVADQGIGIPADRLPHVFDRFARVDPSRARASGGVGLGLSIVKAVVLRHGGRVAATSTPGVGTTITLGLPRSQATS